MSPLAVLRHVLYHRVPFLIYYLDFDFTVSKTATGRLTEFAEAAIASRTRMLAIESAGESGTGLPALRGSDFVPYPLADHLAFELGKREQAHSA